MERKYLIIIAVIAVVCIAFVALFFSGAIHNGSFAVEGTTFGPGTYVVGTDVPEGYYSFDGQYDLEGNAEFKASSNGGLTISNDNVKLESGAKITIHEGASMEYEGK
jgi:hypothetical protein